MAAFLIAVLTLALSPVAASQPLREEKSEAERDVQRLQQQLEDAVERYNYACYRLEETRTQIEQNEESLQAAEAELEKNKARLNNRARALYMTRENRFLDVVVNAENFDEFLVGMDLAKKLGQKDAELVRGVKDAKARLESARESLQQRKAEQEAARQELASAKGAVEDRLSDAEGKLAGIEEQIQQALARRAAAAASSSSSSSGSYPSVVDPISPSGEPPGEPNGGVVEVAYAQCGDPYVWGASGPNAFDCSGLVQYCYKVGAGIYLPHSSYAQARCGARVSVSNLQPGDIVGFRGWGHVGIYVGGGQYIHAPHSGAVVRVNSLSARRDYCGAVRP